MKKITFIIMVLLSGVVMGQVDGNKHNYSDTAVNVVTNTGMLAFQPADSAIYLLHDNDSIGEHIVKGHSVVILGTGGAIITLAATNWTIYPGYDGQILTLILDTTAASIIVFPAYPAPGTWAPSNNISLDLGRSIAFTFIYSAYLQKWCLVGQMN